MKNVLVIVGPRRSGKSSLTEYLAERDGKIIDRLQVKDISQLRLPNGPGTGSRIYVREIPELDREDLELLNLFARQVVIETHQLSGDTNAIAHTLSNVHVLRTAPDVYRFNAFGNIVSVGPAERAAQWAIGRSKW